MLGKHSILAALFLAAILPSCALVGGARAPQEEPVVVAQVDERPITLEEVDDWIRNDLFQQEMAPRTPTQRFEYRFRALDRMIDELVVEREAARRGVGTEELLLEEVEALGPVQAEEISEFFENNRERIRGADTLEAAAPAIRSHLEEQRRLSVVAALREQAGIHIDFQPPRIEIEPTGPSRGPEAAPITIVEFTDYQCPFCKNAEATVEALLERYPEQVRFVVRHYPLDSIHPRARAAAEAAVCAEAQDRFWDYHAKLFQNPRALSDLHLSSYAAELGIAVEEFRSCTQLPETRARVDQDVATAQGAGATGTPVFFVNGIMLSGAQPIDAFVRVIEQELERTVSTPGGSEGSK